MPEPARLWKRHGRTCEGSKASMGGTEAEAESVALRAAAVDVADSGVLSFVIGGGL